MTKYRVFTRTWWLDAACTKPGAGRKRHVCFAQSIEEARGLCQRFNREDFGDKMRGPRGRAYEFESV